VEVVTGITLGARAQPRPRDQGYRPTQLRAGEVLVRQMGRASGDGSLLRLGGSSGGKLIDIGHCMALRRKYGFASCV
jgi:hypothetical protein